MSKVKLTAAQIETLKALRSSGKRMETNAVSLSAGHRYTGWAYGKLRALQPRGLVLCNFADRCSLTTWQITDLGRAALAEHEAKPGRTSLAEEGRGT